MTDHESRTVEELRDELRDRDLKVSGTKDELVARLEQDAEDGDGNQAADPDDDAGDGAPSLRAVVDRIREELSEVLGLDVERITGLAENDDGWRAQADVVEVSRVPPSTDVLATYEVNTDGDGTVVSFERVRRFRRSEGEER